MIELTTQQQQALDTAPETSQVVDPRTNTTYVLVRADVYERLKELLDGAEDQALHKAWLEMATRTRRHWVEENPY